MVNDPARVLSMLADPDTRVVASLAPSYAGIYGRDSARLVGALYALGFDRVEETAVGAREVTGEYRRLMDKGEMPCILTTCCPTVNLLIAQYYPRPGTVYGPGGVSGARPRPDDQRTLRRRDQSGVHRPVPVQDPGDRRASRVCGRGAVLPEAGRDSSERRIAVTEQGERLPEESPVFPDLSCPGRHPAGCILPEQGLLLRRDMPDIPFMSVCGLENVMQFLEELQKAEQPDRLFVELNACEGGCVGGPLIAGGEAGAFRAQLAVRDYAKQPERGSAPPCPGLGQRFEPIARDAAIPDEQTIRKILTEIGKPTRIRSSTADPAAIPPAATKPSPCIRARPSCICACPISTICPSP